MRRYWLALPAVGAVAAGLALFGGQRGESAPADAGKPAEKAAQLKPAVSLPISQVVLFNSGVGYFTRSGEVEGDARVDLTFPEQDINDLIKSMTLRDLSPNGRVAAVTYDSHDPIDRTLASFAINLNNCPVPGPDPDPGPRRAGRGHPGQHGEPAGQSDRQDHRRRAAGRALEGGDGPGVGPEPVVRGRGSGREARRGAAAAVRQPGHRERGPPGPGDAGPEPRQPEEGREPALRRGGEAEGAGRVRGREPDLEDQLPAGAGQGGEAVPAGLGGGGEPDRRGLARGHDGARQRAADLVQDGPVQPAVRGPTDRRARTVRQPAAGGLQRGHAEGRWRGRSRSPPAPRGFGGPGGGDGSGRAGRCPSRPRLGRRRRPTAGCGGRRGPDRGAAPVRPRGGRPPAATAWTSGRACRASPRPRRLGTTSST